MNHDNDDDDDDDDDDDACEDDYTLTTGITRDLALFLSSFCYSCTLNTGSKRCGFTVSMCWISHHQTGMNNEMSTD